MATSTVVESLSLAALYIENRTLKSTMSKQVEYTGEALSMSLYYNGNQVYEPGTYIVSIFADGHMIGSRNFTFEK